MRSIHAIARAAYAFLTITSAVFFLATPLHASDNLASILGENNGTMHDTGTPRCEEKTRDLLTPYALERLSEVFDKEFPEFGGRQILEGGERLTLSDCGEFFTAVPMYPPDDPKGRQVWWPDQFTALIFSGGPFIIPFSGDYLVISR